MNPNKYSTILWAIINNAIPLVGVVFYDWSAFSILLVYWIESGVIGIFQVLKMFTTQVNYPAGKGKGSRKRSIVPGALVKVRLFERLFLPVFFCVHYGGFLIGHFVFLGMLAEYAHQEIVFGSETALAFKSFLITYGISYLMDFVVHKGYKHAPLMRLFVGPYQRVVVMHVVILAGYIPLMIVAAGYPKATVGLIILKIAVDIISKNAGPNTWKRFDNAALKGVAK